MSQYDQGKPSAFQVLLIADIFIRGHHKVKTGLLGGFDQCAVSQFFPAMRPRFFDSMTDEKTGKAARRAIVEKNTREVAY